MALPIEPGAGGAGVRGVEVSGEAGDESSGLAWILELFRLVAELTGSDKSAVPDMGELRVASSEETEGSVGAEELSTIVGSVEVVERFGVDFSEEVDSRLVRSGMVGRLSRVGKSSGLGEGAEFTTRGGVGDGVEDGDGVEVEVGDEVGI